MTPTNKEITEALEALATGVVDGLITMEVVRMVYGKLLPAEAIEELEKSLDFLRTQMDTYVKLRAVWHDNADWSNHLRPEQSTSTDDLRSLIDRMLNNR